MILTIHSAIQKVLPHAIIQVRGSERKYQIDVTDHCFVALNKVQRTQKVYSCINSLIADGSIHAVQISTYLPNTAS